MGYILRKSSCYSSLETTKFNRFPKHPQLTCFSKRLPPVESWSVIVPFSVLSRGLARIKAIQISTWVCKKLFHVYLKNMSYKTNSTRFIQRSSHETQPIVSFLKVIWMTTQEQINFYSKYYCARQNLWPTKKFILVPAIIWTQGLSYWIRTNSTVTGFIQGEGNNTISENKERKEWHSLLIFFLLSAAQRVLQSEALHLTLVALDRFLFFEFT